MQLTELQFLFEMERLLWKFSALEDPYIQAREALVAHLFQEKISYGEGERNWDRYLAKDIALWWIERLQSEAE